MNKLEILLLKMMEVNDYTSAYKSITTYDLSQMENFWLKDDTIYRYLRKLAKDDYLSYGLQEGKRKTFYITQKGIKKLEEYKDV